MVRVKICGITNQNDAAAAVRAGASALGFVFFRGSPRYVTPAQALTICRTLPAGVLKVGVFVDETAARVRSIARQCGLDALQFHGRETPRYCSRFKGYLTIKAFRLESRRDLDTLAPYRVDALLFDSRLGGTRARGGKAFDWRLLEGFDPAGRAVFLAGGLTSRTVAQAIRRVRPDWVDVSSYVESAPGVKDAARMRMFVRTARAHKICP